MQRQHHYTAHSNSRAEHQIETQIRFFSFLFFYYYYFFFFSAARRWHFVRCCWLLYAVQRAWWWYMNVIFWYGTSSLFIFFIIIFYLHCGRIWLIVVSRNEQRIEVSCSVRSLYEKRAAERTNDEYVRCGVCVCEREGESGSNASRMPQISVFSFQFFFMLLQYSVERTQFAGGSTNQCTAAANSLNDSTNKKQKKTQSDEFNNLQFSHVADNRIRMMVSLPAMFSIYTFFFLSHINC